MKERLKSILIVSILLPLTFFFFAKTVSATGLRSVSMLQSDNYLFVANYDDGKLLVFQNTGELIETIVLGNSPSDLLIKGNNLYIALSGTQLIKVINKNTLEEVANIQTPKMPSNLAFDGNLLWATVSRNNGSSFEPFALLLDSSGLLASSTIYQPTWSGGNLVGDEQIIINPNNHTAYLACTGYSPDNIKKFDINNPNEAPLIMQSVHGSLGSNGKEINFSSDYSKIYYSTGSGGNSSYGYSIVVVDPANLTKTASMVIGAYPNANAIYENLIYAGKDAYYDSNDVSVFNQSNILVKAYSLPNNESLVPRGISAGPSLFAATNKYLYLLNQSDTTYIPIYNFLTNTVVEQNSDPITCTSWTYSSWSTCTNRTKTRTILSSSPSGCTGGSPVLTQSCSSTQTCTSWTYSSWTSCINNQQTRTVLSSSPSECTGGSPILTQSCSNGVDLIVSNIAITSNSSGQHIIATVKNIGNQNLVMNHSVILKLTFGTNISEIQSCNTAGSVPCAVGNKYNGGIAINAYGKSTLAPEEEYSITFDNGTYLLEKVEFDNNSNYLIRAMVDWTDMIEESNENNNTITKLYTTTPTCTSWSYSGWSTCSNNLQTRKITSSSPSSCNGGSPILTQSCNSNDSDIKVKAKQIKIDKVLSNKLKGKLLLDVENKGRIFYVNPKDSQKYEVTFANALPLFQKLSLGISNQNLDQISTSKSTTLGKQLAGKLLLQVEDKGRIWYIDSNGKKHEVTWANLMNLFKSLSLGINTENLNKIEENTAL